MEKNFIGAIVGAAIGDSLGMMVEELPIDEVIEFYGEPVKDLLIPHPSSPSYFLRPGENTSEFEIIKLVIESIVERKFIDSKHLIEKYLQWLEKNQIHTYVDPTFLLALESIQEGVTTTLTGSTIDHALVSISIGMFYYKDPYQASEIARTLTAITSRNEVVLDVAAALAVALGELIQGRFYLLDEYEYFIKLLEKFVYKSDTKKYLHKVLNLLKEDVDYETAINELGNGSYCLESFSQALFIFLKTPLDMETTIIKAANAYGNYGGDTDSIALLVGAFSGAYNGEETIPERWKNQLMNYNYIVELAKKFVEVIQT